MNYNDQILENKEFNVFKQFIYNFAVAICIMLLFVLVLVYGFNFNLYNVESDSQAPYYKRGDVVVVKAQKSYEVGDIIKFDEKNGSMPTTHRLIYILEENGVTYYLCHGDAVQNLNPEISETGSWEDDNAYIDKLVTEGMSLSEIKTKCGVLIQTPTINQIEGQVIGWARNYGKYFAFLKAHTGLFIALVGAIWCVSYTIQNEIDIKRSLRLL